jgi:8-oxo-dGTP pyrophosphatase MutT (NUDIX family)
LVIEDLHLFCCTLIFLKYLLFSIETGDAQLGTSRPKFALPLQVAAVCYRRRGGSVEFLLVNTNGGGKWTFPKGDPHPAMSHSRAAEREALEEAGVRGHIEPQHFHVYIHCKGVVWRAPGVQEYVIKAFLLEVEQAARPEEEMRNPTWYSAEEARKVLAKGREVKYARELQAVVDRAVEEIEAAKSVAAAR